MQVLLPLHLRNGLAPLIEDRGAIWRIDADLLGLPLFLFYSSVPFFRPALQKVLPTGVEPVTLGLLDPRSNRLS